MEKGKELKKIIKEREGSVDLLKAIACFFVVACHVNFYFLFPEKGDLIHRVYTSLFSDMTGVFWLCSGFFLYKGWDYLKLLKKSIFKVAIPGAIAIIVTRLYLKGNISFKFIISLLTFNETDVYWYVYAYLLVIIFFPFFKGFTDRILTPDEKGKDRGRIFLIVIFILLIINDILRNKLFYFSFSGFSVMIPAGIETISGAILYKNKEKLINKRCLFISSVSFILVLILRIIITMALDKKNIGSGFLNMWDTSFGFFLAMAMTVIVFNIRIKDKRIPSFLSGYTYPVYLIHPFLLTVLKDKGFFKSLNKLEINPYIYSIIIYLLTVLFLYLISLLLSFLMERAVSVIKSMINKERSKNAV